MPKPTLLFFGNERLSSGFDAKHAPVLRSLVTSGYPVAAVVSNYEPARSRKSRSLEIKDIAEAYDIPVLLPDSPRDIIEHLQSYRADAGVLVAYGRIIPQSIIDLFPAGIINIHPSALPKYRGSTPIESAILNGDAQLTVSLMALAKEMDAGPVYAQRDLPLSDSASKHEITQQALELGAAMLIEHLPAILDGTLTPLPQDESQATYCSLIKKDDSLLDWSKPAIQLAREVRAYAGWPGSKTTVAGIDITVVEAVANGTSLPSGSVRTDDQRLLIGTASGSLEITQLRPAGRGTMRAADFLRGLKNK